LCATNELQSNQTKSFSIEGQKIFVVRDDNKYFAYLNNCPHQNIPLDWDNGQFLDYDKELIQCSSHGALFVIETGTCVAGPCIGASLKALDLKVVDNTIYLINEL